MNKLKSTLVLVPLILFAAGFSGCYEDSDGDGEADCESPPASCDTSSPPTGSVKLRFTTDDDNSSIDWELRRGSVFDSGTYVDSGTTLSDSVSFDEVNGTYSARAIYTFTYKGTIYTIEAVDSDTLSPDSESYCGGVTCYDEGSISLNLEFDIDGFKDYIDKKDAKCFIATAAFGSPDCPQVRYLRSFRDTVLTKHRAGRAFIDFYYTHSPAIAEVIEKHPVLRNPTRMVLSVLVEEMRHPFAYFFAQILILVLLIAAARYLTVKRFNARKE